MSSPEPRSGHDVPSADLLSADLPSSAVRPLAVLANEFASVEVGFDEGGHSPRLLLRDPETGGQVLISPIELASLCLARADDRLNWLRVGQYRSERER
jgi:hypothetical protein